MRISKTRGWPAAISASARHLVGAAAAAAVLVPALILSGPASSAELKVGMREFPAGRGNPYQGCVCSPAIFVWSSTYQQLAQVGRDGRAFPVLAESWEAVDDTTWHFKLRPGIKFSNGEPLNAQAVKATYDFLATDEGKTFSQSRTLGVFIAETNVIDDLTVEVKTPTAQPVFAKLSTTQSIIPPQAFADVGIEGFTNNPIGTGPYIVKFEGENATGTPFAGSWVKRADVDLIQFIVLPEAPARSQALVSEQIDVNVQLGPDEFDQIRGAGMKVFAAPSTRTMGLSLITTRSGEPVTGPLADKRVRQALNYAVNKQAVIDAIFGGIGNPASQAAVPTAFGYNSDIKPYPYDPDKARALLAEAGYGDGFDLEFRAIVTSTDFRFAYEAAVQDLNRIGINATLIAQQFAGGDGWLEHWIKGDWPYEGFGFGNDLTGHLDAGLSFARHVSCTKPAPYYCNPDEMALIEQAYVEFDVNKREQMLREALKINAENAPIIYLIEFEEAMGYNPKITNFENVNLWVAYNELKISM